MDRDEAQQLAKHWMSEYLGDDWQFRFTRGKRTLGICNYTRSFIGISVHFIDHGDRELIEQTILHEIAHATAGKQAGHGSVWRDIAESLGVINPTATCDTLIEIPSRFIAKCERCGQQ